MKKSSKKPASKKAAPKAKPAAKEGKSGKNLLAGMGKPKKGHMGSF